MRMHFKIKNINNRKYLYVIKNERINGKVVQTIQKSVGSADKVYELLTKGTSQNIASYSFGKPAAFMKAAEEVGLIESFNEHVDRKDIEGLTPAEYLLLIIIGKAEKGLTRKSLDKYFRKSSLQFVWSPKYKLSSQNFLNYMAKLDENTIEKIELDISRNLVRQGIIPAKLIFDNTYIYTNIEHGEQTSQKGQSKEKRDDKNLIGIGLNVPSHSFTYSGNEPDAKLFLDLIDSICKRLKEIQIPAEDMVLIFDRGMNSGKNIGKAMGEMNVVGSIPGPMCRKELMIPASEYSESWEDSSEKPIKAQQVNRYGPDLAGVVTYSESNKLKQAEEWEQTKAKVMEEIEEIRLKLNRKGKGRKMTAKGLINRVVAAIPEQYRDLFDYSATEKDGKLELGFELNPVKEAEFMESMGKTVIFTDRKDLTTQQIVELYDSGNTIENDFKWIKDRLLIPLKPAFVRKEEMIRPHIFLCVLGLLLRNYLLHLLKDEEVSISKLEESLGQIRLALVYNGKDRKNAGFVIEEMNKEAAEVFSKLQLGEYIPD